jgi:hypothetical protein
LSFERFERRGEVWEMALLSANRRKERLTVVALATPGLCN